MTDRSNLQVPAGPRGALNHGTRHRPFSGFAPDDDVAKAKESLVSMGYLSPSHLESERDCWGKEAQDAFEHFQRDHGLCATGALKGDDMEILMRCAETARSVQSVDRL